MIFKGKGRYLYHYSAFYQNGHQNAYIDGIIEAKNRITSHEEYMKIKPVINKEHADALVVTSLSYIGRKCHNED